MSIANIKLFFTPSYFFNPYPGFDMQYIEAFLAFFGVLAVASIVLALMVKRTRKNKPLKILLGAFANIFAWFGGLGLFLIAMRYEGIPFISARVVLFLLLTALVIWIIYLLIFGIKKYKKTKKEFKENLEKEKYFKRK